MPGVSCELVYIHIQKGLAWTSGNDRMGDKSHEDSGLNYGREQKPGI